MPLINAIDLVATAHRYQQLGLGQPTSLGVDSRYGLYVVWTFFWEDCGFDKTELRLCLQGGNLRYQTVLREVTLSGHHREVHERGEDQWARLLWKFRLHERWTLQCPPSDAEHACKREAALAPLLLR